LCDPLRGQALLGAPRQANKLSWPIRVTILIASSKAVLADCQYVISMASLHCSEFASDLLNLRRVFRVETGHEAPIDCPVRRANYCAAE
jgi:hypothetical protein